MFSIAQEVAETKMKHYARTLFFRAKLFMGKQPKTLITKDCRVTHWRVTKFLTELSIYGKSL
ncbi:MAG TPA: hypothetical protein VJL33_02450 [Candidatus Bathyarchaeia archaeon]|nr:hypothetical protein [Candidatus Bathyarchaeia archaeon]